MGVRASAGLEIRCDGSVDRIANANEKFLRERLGNRFAMADSRDGTFRVFVHELSRAAHLPINSFASIKSGRVIGGDAIVTGIAGHDLDDTWFSSQMAREAAGLAKDDSLRVRLEDARLAGESRPHFKKYPPDRWLMNGLAFKVVVVGESDRHQPGRAENHDVWLFGENSMEPYTMQISEFSLLETMEILSAADEEIFNGSVPRQFESAVMRLGIVTG